MIDRPADGILNFTALLPPFGVRVRFHHVAGIDVIRPVAALFAVIRADVQTPDGQGLFVVEPVRAGDAVPGGRRKWIERAALRPRIVVIIITVRLAGIVNGCLTVHI